MENEQSQAPKRKRKSRPYQPRVKQEHSLIDVTREFATEEQCLGYLEQMRWPEGVECLECGSKRISTFKAVGRTRTNKHGVSATGPDRHLYQCLDCKHQFTATTGTVFHDTHLSLVKWFQAIAVMAEGKKGVSALQMQRHLNIGSYRTAWHLNHRIRKAMVEDEEGQLTGTVEVDETYIGGRYDKRRKRARWDKEPVFGMVERGGKVRTWHVPQINRWNIMTKLEDNISIQADLVCTDDSQMYIRMPETVAEKHEIVNHSAKQWVRGTVHTGTIDGYWSLLKRGIIGSFHQISIKHLHRYLAEFACRWNNREHHDLFGRIMLGLLIQGALEYAELTSRKQAPQTSDAEPLADQGSGNEPF